MTKRRLYTQLAAVTVLIIMILAVLNVVFDPRYRTPANEPYAPPIVMQGFIVFPKITPCTLPNGQPGSVANYVPPFAFKTAGGHYSYYAYLYIATGKTVTVENNGFCEGDIVTGTESNCGFHSVVLRRENPAMRALQKLCWRHRFNLMR